MAALNNISASGQQAQFYSTDGGSTWGQIAYAKASNTGAADRSMACLRRSPSSDTFSATKPATSSVSSDPTISSANIAQFVYDATHTPRLMPYFIDASERDLLSTATAEISISDDAFDLKRVLRAISDWKTRGVSPADARREVAAARESGNRHDDYAVLSADAYGKYEEVLRASGAVDFDDLLLLPVKLLEEEEEVRRSVWKRWHYVMIDEYQDTNAVQLDLARLLRTTHCMRFVGVKRLHADADAIHSPLVQQRKFLVVDGGGGDRRPVGGGLEVPGRRAAWSAASCSARWGTGAAARARIIRAGAQRRRIRIRLDRCRRRCDGGAFAVVRHRGAHT